MKDFFGKELKIEDYICYPAIEGTSRIEYRIDKICKIHRTSMSVLANSWWNSRELITTVLYRPSRAIIISEEVALEKEPLFKEMM